MSPREQLLAQIQHLNDKQIDAVLHYIESLPSEQPYSEANDPFLNGTLRFEAESDFAERSEDWLREQINKRAADQ